MTDPIALRNERFPDLPPRIAKLKVSDRGFPVPWFVAWIDGKPDFRVVENGKMAEAVNHGKCWVCGDRLGAHKAFVIGPMCGVNRTISDPPSHRECAIWAAQNCPFLSRPLAQRNTRDPLPEGSSKPAGYGLSRNPMACGVWITKAYRPFRTEHGTGGVLFNIGEPDDVLWFSSGREATRAEVDHSVETGLPHLYALAHQQGAEAVHHLDRQVAGFHQLLERTLPAEVVL